MTLQFPLPQERILPHRISISWPPRREFNDSKIDNRIDGSLVGLAVGDALGASVEFRPQKYLAEHPVHGMMGGGTWGLQAGQWTDDTSMALCLASSLITKRTFNPYDQLVRYKWWYRYGYLSSTGKCFDIGNATRNAIEEFSRRQEELRNYLNLWSEEDVDRLPIQDVLNNGFDVYCSNESVEGNGALMRLAPVPIFFYRTPKHAVRYAGESARLTHGGQVAVDACRYYAALIVAAIRGESKEDILSSQFYSKHQAWFNNTPLHADIVRVANGSFKKRRGYKDGIRGKGHVMWTLEAALWAFWSSDSFEQGALNAVNLGDDTDTTAAIYGQLAGAYYGYRSIPPEWMHQLYASNLLISTAAWLQYYGPSEERRRDEQIEVVNRRQILGPHPQPMPTYLHDDIRQRKEPKKNRSKSADNKKRRTGGTLLGCGKTSRYAES